MSSAKKTNSKVFMEPLLAQNNIMVQTLGICSSLAVTVQMKPALVMCLGLTLVTALSSFVLSCIRNFIPGKIRIITYMVVVASMVIVADQFLKAYMFDVSKQLSVFFGLIITNCIVMGRAEAFAMSNPPVLSFIDGIGSGLGYSGVLMIVATCREFFGSGKLFGHQIIAQTMYDDLGFVNNGLMLLPPGAFFILAMLIWLSKKPSVAAKH